MQMNANTNVLKNCRVDFEIELLALTVFSWNIILFQFCHASSNMLTSARQYFLSRDLSFRSSTLYQTSTQTLEITAVSYSCHLCLIPQYFLFIFSVLGCLMIDSLYLIPLRHQLVWLYLLIGVNTLTFLLSPSLTSWR